MPIYLYTYIQYLQPYLIPNTIYIYYTPNICWLPIYKTTTPTTTAITKGEEGGYTTPTTAIM